MVREREIDRNSEREKEIVRVREIKVRETDKEHQKISIRY